MKKCPLCLIEKNINEFYLIKRTSRPSYYCKLCDKLKSKEWRNKNPDKARSSVEEWVRENRERSNEIKKNWEKRNPEKVRITQNKTRKKLLINNPQFKLSQYIKNRTKSALKRQKAKKYNKAVILLGIPLSEFIIFIQNKFNLDMTWSNYGKVWHLDEIIPCSAFDLTKEEQQKICFNYRNRQPLLAKDNYKKGGAGGKPVGYYDKAIEELKNKIGT